MVYAIVGLLLVPILTILILRYSIKRTTFCKSTRRLTGKTILITGGNCGIGREVALDLAKRGGRVIIACRNKERGRAAVEQIKLATNNQDVFFRILDLASLSSIRDFARDFNQEEARLDILINNAAYLGPKDVTADNFERTMGVNYIGHFLLFNLLLDKLKHSAPCRVVNVLSDSYGIGHIDTDDLNGSFVKYDSYSMYGTSKLAILLFTMEADKSFKDEGITSYAVHPGATNTSLLRNWPGVFGTVLRLVAMILFRSPVEGAQSIINTAVIGGIEEFSGKLFYDCKVIELDHKCSKQLYKASMLWKATEALCETNKPITQDEEKKEI
ncbi:unnamed protein product [Owenia fusiformis]|uniref:Uncharacterized protein n=1 Tax=Owenia fusiformis TaxID=6347 RepID=A0A8J1TP51_OWEFU|nr:unnamed protein product [Owenia fusiformis]